ncbi:unnamed protein product [Acanthoscelides obtectus]|uniref:Uncharacterized protein n=1 Tax=Acanthoscelides obtectus TaxID=200917 RepID=A0A9P0K7J3_ACAOB|nr:unnamed protein product [Acanthoscelides obtectus]CAK1662535.1 hypothetical protein AOBTE_LOCUS23200 [Acanthoscelides obtectus]
MSSEKFNQLFDLLRIPLTKQNTKFRQSISPHERLTIFLSEYVEVFSQNEEDSSCFWQREQTTRHCLSTLE